MPRTRATYPVILLSCLFSALPGCVTVTTADYTPPDQGAIADIRFETSETRVVNSRVHLYPRRGCEQPALVGLLNSRLIGSAYRHSLDTRITAGQPLTVSVFSALYRDVGALDVLTQSAETITAGLGYCETFLHFTPRDGHRYLAIYNAQYRGCDMDIYELDGTGTATLIPDATIDDSCHLKPLGNAQVYDGILTRDQSRF